VIPRAVVIRTGPQSRQARRRHKRRLTIKELLMNWDRIEGNWKQIKGQVQQHWGELTDDDFDVIDSP
jgi:hypothetical protein